MHQILLYYKYVHIDDPVQFAAEQTELCQKLKLTGRIIVAHEGLNGTVEGTESATESYIKQLVKDPRFADTDFKKSSGTGQAFPKLSVKVRSEIVSGHLGSEDIDPTRVTGKYITAEELHDWINSDKKFYLVDMRNDYEQAVGYFDNSILAPFHNFRDLPKVLPVLDNLRGCTIVTVCTGGVRCEKASGFLVKNGFTDVYQLYGGIVTYMEKYPNEDFLGKLYVFDGRVTIGFNTEDPKHQVVGKCKNCNNSADTYYDCKNLFCRKKRHFISCQQCLDQTRGYCSPDCQAIYEPAH